MTTFYIGADVHSNSTELAIEEGTMSGWLYRNLHDKLEQFISSDPRRNKLIASDGDKDDKIDAAKLASLLRGGFLRAIHHSDDDGRAELKHWVSLYHDRVRDAVRSINKIRARCRMHGVTISRSILRDPASRLNWFLKTNHSPLANQLKMLWIGYDANVQQVKFARGQLSKLSKEYDIIEYWSQLPGIGPIRATTIFAYLDTPWRFKKKNKLWKYCGVGLQRTTSGTDKNGRPKPARLKLP